MLSLLSIGLRDEGAEILMMLFCEMMIILPIMILMIASMWKVFTKAGLEGWQAIIPIYNTYILVTKIAGKDTNHFILHLIPLVNIYATIVTYIAVAKSFGKDDGYGIGLFLLGIVFWPMLAFSKSINFVGPGGITPAPTSNNALTSDWQHNNPQNPPQN